MPGAKQVFRESADGKMHGDVIARVEEQLPGRPLLVPFVRNGRLVREETIEQMSRRARAELEALPEHLRELDGEGEVYPVIVLGALPRRAGGGRRAHFAVTACRG